MVRVVALSAVAAIFVAGCALDMSGLDSAEQTGEGGAEGTPDATAGGSDASEPDSGGGAIESGSPAEEAATASGGDGGGAPAQTGDAAPDAPSEAGTVCDQDGDGYLAVGPQCGGTDCCDTDKNVHPGQTAFFTTPGACGGFDYDCNGQITEEYGAASCSWNTFSCSGDGFAAPVPGCGDFGTFTSCSIPWYDVFSCTGSNAQQAQGCR